MSQSGSPSKADDVADALEIEILRDHPVAGARVGRRTDLISRFGVSAGVMNEALRLLRERNLIAVKPGPRGGVFVANRPPGVRLGALDLWFQTSTLHPLEIFESRDVLEDAFNHLALARADTADLRAVRRACDHIEDSAGEPESFFHANVRFHLAVAKAAKIGLLADMYVGMMAVLTGTLVRAEFTDGYQSVVEHSVAVHREIFDAIGAQDRTRLEAAMRLHRVDMVSLAEPAKSPGVTRGDSRSEERAG